MTRVISFEWERTNSFADVDLPSGRRAILAIPSPTTTADREWLRKYIDLLVSEEDEDTHQVGPVHIEAERGPSRR